MSGAMHIDSCYGAAAWLAGLAITLVLASWLTPRAWWRRPTARNLCIAAAGTWAFGSLILHFAGAAPPQLAQGGLPASLAPASAAAAGFPYRPAGTGAKPPAAAALLTTATALRPFRVHRDLNLRAAASVEAQRLALVPAGASVMPTGARSGDWWEVRTLGDGKTSTGWVSSLWLRRAAE